MTLNELRDACKHSNKCKRENNLSNMDFENILGINEGGNNFMSTSDARRGQQPCPQLPGTVLRIFIPAGAVINLLNLIEVTTPSGICLIVRLPILGGSSGCNSGNFDLGGIANSIRQAGGTVEFSN